MRSVFHLLAIVGLTIAAALPAVATTQALPQDATRAEVIRRGDAVERVTTGHAADSALDALAPPASDADKWFISVLTTRKCAGCKELQTEWKRSPWLLALADPADPKKSWAHYRVYDLDDQSQAFRFDALAIAAYPTILIQPPRTGVYGSPTTVVYQDVYRGDPQQTSKAMVDAIRAYTIRYNDSANVKPPWSPSPVTPDVAPYTPYEPPNVQPYVQPDRTPFRPFKIPPLPLPDSDTGGLFSIPWGKIFLAIGIGLGIPLAIPLTIILILVYRRRRVADTKSLLRKTVATGVGLGAVAQLIPMVISRLIRGRKAAAAETPATPATATPLPATKPPAAP